MSSRNYQVLIDVKDGGVLSKLEKLQKGSPVGGVGGGGSQAGGIGGIWKKIEGLNLGQLAKLSVIGIGVGSVVALLTKSSGILQGTFKLMETSFMLALKPMADFFGLIFRPIAIALLTQMVIPFYKHVSPWFREWGPKIGEALVNLPQTIVAFFSDAGTNISAGFELAAAGLQGAWDAFVGNVSGTLSNVPNMLWGYFVSVGESIWTRLQETGSMFWGFFVSIADSIWHRLSAIPNVFWGYFVGIADSIFNTLSGIPDMFVGVFTSLASALGEALSDIPQLIHDVIANAAKGDYTVTTSLAGRLEDHPRLSRADIAGLADTRE